LVEFPYRPLPEHELWAADVAYARRERWQPADLESIFSGAPDLIVEVLSPSNTASEMDEKSALCLENGCIEFWVVNPKTRSITVHTSGNWKRYKTGDSVPVERFFPGQPTVPVDYIFNLMV
jgi:Uma2 family endonuclease